MTLRELQIWEEFLENIVQFGWLGTLTNSSPSQLVELGIDCMKVQDSSWMKMISKDKCISKIVLMIKLFLQMF